MCTLKKFLPLLALGLLALHSLGCDNTADFEGISLQTNAIDTPIVYGESATEAATVALGIPGEGTFCSGTLITPTVVLTAAHCLDLGIALEGLANVHFGSTYGSGGQTREIIRTNLHENWAATNTNDIGFVELASAAPADISPVPYLPASMALDSADIGNAILFSGFGVTEDGSNGERLQFWGSLASLCLGTSWCGGTPPHSFTYNHSSGGPCSGDSGGPAYMDIGGTRYVVGVNAAVDSVDNNCLGASVGFETLVQSYADLISDFIAGEDVGPSSGNVGGDGGIIYTACSDICNAGDSCDVQADCDGFCFTEDSYGIPGGYCSSACTTNSQCGSGDFCLDDGDGVGVCFDGCTSHSQCRTGYACTPIGAGQSACYPGEVPDGGGPAGESPIGEACETNADCNGNICWSEAEFGIPGGQCTSACSTDADCPQQSFCAGSGACYPQCDANTPCERDGYLCWPYDGPDSGVCFADCRDYDVCGDAGCNDQGLCGNEAPIEGTEAGGNGNGSDGSSSGSGRSPQPDKGCAAVSGGHFLGMLGLLFVGRRRRALA